MPEVVVDETGRELQLGGTLGVPGTQGEVRRVIDRPELAVKLLMKTGQIDYEAMRRLPIVHLPVSTPIALLRDGRGYVMELAGDMTPIEDLVPRYSPGFVQKHDIDWYVASGGLRRRLRLLARTAGALARLHGLSLTFVDINPGNVMISTEVSFDEIMLIDVDNVGYSSLVGAGVHTPGFQVPERTKGLAGPNTLTDSYAFAILAHALLRMRYPFDGDAAQELDGDAAIEAMDRGDLTYIDDPDDPSNRATSGGLPAAACFSPVLIQLMERNFVGGRRDPSIRPSLTSWSEALWRASENTIVCRSCNWSYFRTTNACVRCGEERPNLLGATVWRSEDAIRPVRQAVQVAGTSRELTRRMLFGSDSDESVVKLEHDGRRLQLVATASASVSVISSTSGIKERRGNLEGRFAATDAVRVRIDASDAPPRVLDIRWL